MDVKDCNVLVTGANRGLGAALVEVALERGASRVYAGARDLDSLEVVRRLDPDRIVPVSSRRHRLVADCGGGRG